MQALKLRWDLKNRINAGVPARVARGNPGAQAKSIL